MHWSGAGRSNNKLYKAAGCGPHGGSAVAAAGPGRALSSPFKTDYSNVVRMQRRCSRGLGTVSLDVGPVAQVVVPGNIVGPLSNRAQGHGLQKQGVSCRP